MYFLNSTPQTGHFLYVNTNKSKYLLLRIEATKQSSQKQW